jgi:O-methyltransferase involved in polyketide biosynthesis
MTLGRANAEPPPEIDPSRPHPARIYDYAIGGKNHFAADREMAERALARVPAGRTAARENRAFLGRAVRYLAEEAGIRQFLDIGTGLPATVNVHEVAQRAAPESRVLYVDNDPMVLAHARALLTSGPQGRTGYVQADLRDPAGMLESPVTREVIDFTRPVALLLAAVLHYLQDEDSPGKIVAELTGALPPGSYLVASHVTGEHNPAGWGAVEREYRRAGIGVQWRDGDEFARLAFAGLEMVPPGVVLVSEWRPDADGPRPAPAEVSVYGGAACKR